MEEKNPSQLNQIKMQRGSIIIVDYLSIIGLVILLMVVSTILVIIVLSFTLIFAT